MGHESDGGVRYWQLLTGVAMAVLQLVRTALFQSYFRHYTAWNWTLVTLFVIVDACGPHQRWLSVTAGPLALASATFVGIASVIMFVQKFRVVEDALDEYPDAYVYVGNIVIHYVDIVVLVLVMVLRRRPQPAATWPALGVRIGLGVFLGVFFFHLYFSSFSPKHEYGAHGWSDRDLRNLGHVCFVALAAAAVLVWSIAGVNQTTDGCWRRRRPALAKKDDNLPLYMS